MAMPAYNNLKYFLINMPSSKMYLYQFSSSSTQLSGLKENDDNVCITGRLRMSTSGVKTTYDLKEPFL